MISHAQSVIFVHIPRTAGQSIERAFLALHGLNWRERKHLLLGANTAPSHGPNRLAHLRASQYVSCGHISPAAFERYFKFAFVRNPWDRAVSSYYFVKRSRPAMPPFRDYVRGMQARRRERGPALNQADFIFDAGRLLVDFVGRFENLQVDFARVCEQLGLGPIPLPHHNAAIGRGSHRDYYDLETREAIQVLFREDIERFGYSF